MRLIDADAVIRCECGQCDGHCNTFDGEECLKCTSHNKCQLREALDSAPTVDAVEVVRCKDCKERTQSGGMVLHCSLNGIQVDDDDFCSYGRKLVKKDATE